jgi:endogenous inhibitor of DNA gyrase (YacG/DUF329 family)
MKLGIVKNECQNSGEISQNSNYKPFCSSQKNCAQMRLKQAKAIFLKIRENQRQIHQTPQVFEGRS